MKTFLFLSTGFLLLCSIASAQNEDAAQAAPSKAHLHADCQKFNSPGCKSFNAMVAADNPDIADILDTAGHSVVCFHRAEDVFFVIAYDHVQAAAFAGHEPGYKLSSVVNFERFKNRVGEAFKGFLGSWHKEPDGIRFSIDARQNEPNVRAEVRPGEISFSYQYHPDTSAAGSGSGSASAANTIIYGVTVHLSTLRFVENFRKTGPSAHSTQNTGACASF